MAEIIEAKGFPAVLGAMTRPDERLIDMRFLKGAWARRPEVGFSNASQLPRGRSVQTGDLMLVVASRQILMCQEREGRPDAGAIEIGEVTWINLWDKEAQTKLEIGTDNATWDLFADTDCNGFVLFIHTFLKNLMELPDEYRLQGVDMFAEEMEASAGSTAARLKDIGVENAAPSATVAEPPHGAAPDVASEVIKVAELYKKGLLTEDEFVQMKRRILGL